MLSSRGEVKIHEILQKHGLRFVEEYSIDGLNSSNGKPLRFDFAVLDDDGNLDFLIEYQGIQHYEPNSRYGGKKGFYRQQYNDNQKRRFCKIHDITLIEIPYTDEHLISYDYIMSKAGY